MQLIEDHKVICSAKAPSVSHTLANNRTPARVPWPGLLLTSYDWDASSTSRAPSRRCTCGRATGTCATGCRTDTGGRAPGMGSPSTRAVRSSSCSCSCAPSRDTRRNCPYNRHRCARARSNGRGGPSDTCRRGPGVVRAPRATRGPASGAARATRRAWLMPSRRAVGRSSSRGPSSASALAASSLASFANFWWVRDGFLDRARTRGNCRRSGSVEGAQVAIARAPGRISHYRPSVR